MKELIGGPLDAEDLRLISYIRDESLYQPSDKAYHLDNDISAYHSQHSIEEVIDYIFNNKVR